MRVTVIAPPGEVISREEVKQHCKIETNDDDVLVDAYIDAAVRWLDGPSGWLGRALGKQTLEMVGWFGGRCIKLPYPPIVGNVSIVVDDIDGNETTVDPASYRFNDGIITVSSGASWVSKASHRVRYDAGYEELPAPIKVAIFMLVAHWYENREAVGGTFSDVPTSANALLSTYRVW